MAGNILHILKGQRPRKLYKYLYQLPNFGVGRRFTRVIWKHDSVLEGEDRWGDPSSYWTITRVRPDGTLKSGLVWGRRTWKGESEDKEKIINTHRKKHWKIIPNNY